MGLKNEVDALYLAQLESGNIRYTVQPAALAGIALVSNGVVAAWAWAPYVQICAAAAVADPCWIVGFLLHTGVVETHYGDLAIASGALAAEVDLAIAPFQLGLPGVTVNSTYEPPAVPTWLPYPIKVIGTPRLAARIRKSTAASAAGGVFKVILAQAVGT